MDLTLIPPEAAGDLAVLEHAAHGRAAGDPVLVAALIELVAKANADSTRLAYAKAWRRFYAWAGLYGCDPFDGRPETVALHLAGRRDKAHATLRIDVAGIAYALGLLGIRLDTGDRAIALLLRGHAREKGRAPQRQAFPLLPDAIGRILAGLDGSPRAVRNRALLLLAFGGALRRSELVALDLADVTVVDQGVELRLRRSKTDQEGEGRLLAIHAATDPVFCPRRALIDWLAVRAEAMAAAEGRQAAWAQEGHDGSETRAGQATTLARAIVAARPALFWRCDRGGRPVPQRLSAGSVALLVKELVAGVGLDPAAYSGHSPRAGLVTAADAAGASPIDIAVQSRHASLDTVRRYIRRSSAWRRNVTKGLLDQVD